MTIEQIHTKYLFKTRRLLYNKAKLKAISRTSALLSGFSMIAMVETQLNDHKESLIFKSLIITYSTLTCLVVGVHLLALMISSCMLSILDADSLFHSKEYQTMQIYIEFAWILSSGFGIFLFLLEVMIICWVKFYFITRPAAIATTIIIIPIIILFCTFSLNFYRRLIRHQVTQQQNELHEIENTLTTMKSPIVKII